MGPRTASQGYEVCRRYDDPLWLPSQGVRRYRRATRPPPTGSLGGQGQDLKAPRRVRHERTQDAVPRYCADLGAQGGDQPSRTEGQGCPINKEQFRVWFPVISSSLLTF